MVLAVWSVPDASLKTQCKRCFGALDFDDLFLALCGPRIRLIRHVTAADDDKFLRDVTEVRLIAQLCEEVGAVLLGKVFHGERAHPRA